MMTENETKSPARSSDPVQAATLTAHKIKVLLIDDQAIVGAAVKRMLEPETDIVFQFCQDPTQAIPIATEFQPTVILQDLIMPDIDGLTLVKFFRVHPGLKDVPLIVLSSKEEALTKADAFALGANDYLVKLPDRIELIARIRYHSQGYINLLQRNEAYAALLASRQALAAELAQAADYVVSLMPPPLSDPTITTAWRFFPSASWAATASVTTGSMRILSPSISSMSADTGSARRCSPFRPSTPSAPRRFPTRTSILRQGRWPRSTMPFRWSTTTISISRSGMVFSTAGPGSFNMPAAAIRRPSSSPRKES